tara:strand:- start:128 stop:331 length:204 start_codon:yes stop_codon:yes gene_type:complete
MTYKQKLISIDTKIKTTKRKLETLLIEYNDVQSAMELHLEVTTIQGKITKLNKSIQDIGVDLTTSKK